MTIIVTRDGKDPKILKKQDFENEDWLQDYINKVSDSIPLYGEDTKLFIIDREFSTKSGPIDALGIDVAGQIYVIETKLDRNSDKRHIIAQLLDYGASLWSKTSFDEFFNDVDSRVNKNFGMSFNQKIREFFETDDDDKISSIIDNMRGNLSDGIFKFVILMDKIEEKLKDLVLFINQSSNFKVHAVELEHYKFNDYELIIPKLFGAEVKKTTSVSHVSGERKQWNEPSFFDDAKNKLNEEQYQAVQKLFEFSKTTSGNNIRWGTGSQNGSFGVIFDKISDRSLYSVFSNGLLSLNFHWLNRNEKEKKYRDQFKDKLSKISGITISSYYTEGGFVKLPIEQWYGVREDFMNAVQDLIS